MTLLRAVGAALPVCLAIAGCTAFDGIEDEPEEEVTVTLVTHESWQAPREVLDAFEDRSGIRLQIRRAGDAEDLVDKLTESDRAGDVAFGVNSNDAGRALDAEVFEPYTSPESDRGPQRYTVDSQHRLSAVAREDVCVNIDSEWFAEHDVSEPEELADLIDSSYEGLLVAPSPVTSSTGLTFLLATIAEFDDEDDPGWREYWQQLRDNETRVTDDWSEAYTQHFSGAAQDGDRPIVVSYASSPVAASGDGESDTRAVSDTCYQRVEYAGVLAGTEHPEQAGQVVDFLLSQEFQNVVAENMSVYPTREGAALPSEWQEVAPLPDDSASLSSERVEANRQWWVQQWRETWQR